ncbi:MAG: redoxin domain-containing protein [Lacunisphaera sp.]
MKPFRLFLMLSSLLGFIANLSADPLKVGDAAPAVSATTETGATLALADVYPKGYTLVYFYPKADTPGCTKQGCSLRDSYETLLKKASRSSASATTTRRRKWPSRKSTTCRSRCSPTPTAPS